MSKATVKERIAANLKASNDGVFLRNEFDSLAIIGRLVEP